MSCGLIGTVENGQKLHFTVSNRNLATGAAIGGYTPAYFDVIDPETSALLIANGTLRNETDRDLWHGTIDTSAAGFEAKTYCLVVKGGTEENPTTAFVYDFTVTPPYAEQHLWLRNDVENVEFSRWRRLLGLSGENLMIDNFDYDASGNITNMRIRLFEDKASAESATPDITDLEPGEFAQYTVTQAHNAPRNVRTSHVSVLDTVLDDTDATDNQRTDVVNAPGNEGDWPE